MLKLPRLLETETENQLLFHTMQKSFQTFSPEGTIKVPCIELNDNLIQALAFARRCGSLRGGLESIETLLQTEEAGLVSMRSRQKSKDPNRISRVLIFSNDGSDRFYRHCETLLAKYKSRVFGIKINADSVLLGKSFFGKEKAVKAMLVSRKDAVIKVLSAVMSNS
ncbi:hypothetical protein GCL60_14755 [Silvanigrella paludirubra]|jgi:hypothetical protein|uniref:Uncharacterized protein n=1 Tax=Silvanigrella paludirubra TaxID=2499159 RepID=A0A6N6VQX5_9BACT|nr:hypothetical protein [Silvanigrella paludirubra]KAB8037087.1 hypothetical protein GCL60_14755 [Silvanigrella paludirubra]